MTIDTISHCRTARAVPTLCLTLGLSLTAAAAEAGECKNGQSYDVTGTMQTPSNNWFCQTHTAGTRNTNRALDDWRSYMASPGPDGPNGAGELVNIGVGGGGQPGPTGEVLRLQKQRQALAKKIEALRAKINARPGLPADPAVAQAAKQALEKIIDQIAVQYLQALEVSVNRRAEAKRLEETLREGAATGGTAAIQSAIEIQANAAREAADAAAAAADNLGNQADALNNRLETLEDGFDVVTERMQLQLADLEKDLAYLDAKISVMSEVPDADSDDQGDVEFTPVGLRASFKNAPVAPPNWAWWATGELSVSDQSGGVMQTKATTASFLTGFSTQPMPGVGLSFGVGYSHGVTDETDPFGGGTSTANTFKSRLTGYVTEGGLTFDASATFDYSWIHRDRGFFTDDYKMHEFGLGLGVNGAMPLATALTLDWRLGYAGTWTVRHASVDTFGIANSRALSQLHRASAMAKLSYALPDGAGTLYGDATLNAILADDTMAARTTNPFDLDLGAGGSFDIGGLDLDIGASFGGIGRTGETSYGLRASVSLDF